MTILLSYDNIIVNRKKGNIWEFGVEIDNEEVYIKLSDDLSHNIAKCISFHKTEFKISYPYKKGGKLR